MSRGISAFRQNTLSVRRIISWTYQFYCVPFLLFINLLYLENVIANYSWTVWTGWLVFSFSALVASVERDASSNFVLCQNKKKIQRRKNVGNSGLLFDMNVGQVNCKSVCRFVTEFRKKCLPIIVFSSQNLRQPTSININVYSNLVTMITMKRMVCLNIIMGIWSH